MSRLKLSAVERIAIWKAHQRKCIYTGEPVSYSEFQIDHVLPESLADQTDEWDRIKQEYGLGEAFDINSYYNLVPCKSTQNLRKGEIIFNKARALFFLQIAEERYPKVIQYIQEEREQLQSGKALMTLTKYLEEGHLTIEEISHIVSTYTSAESIFRILHGLDFADGAYIDQIAQSDIEDLRDRPLLIGGNPDINGVKLTNDDDHVVTVQTCREYKRAIEEGYYALTTVAIKLASFFEQQCGLLTALSQAQPVVESYIDEPRVGVVDLNLLPVTLFPDIAEERFSSEQRKEYASITYKDWVDEGELRIKSVTQSSILVESASMGQYLLEVARGDFNEDGVEDILVYVSCYAVGGSLGYGYAAILTRTGPDQIFTLCD